LAHRRGHLGVADELAGAAVARVDAVDDGLERVGDIGDAVGVEAHVVADAAGRQREVVEEGAAVDVEQMEPPRGPLMSEAQTHRRRLASSTLAPENWSGSSLVKKTCSSPVAASICVIWPPNSRWRRIGGCGCRRRRPPATTLGCSTDRHHGSHA
jgi:hypothetical protein